MKKEKGRTIAPFIEWTESSIILDNNEYLRFQKHQKKILGHALRLDKNGKLSYSNIVYSCPKKSGKTAVLSFVTLWFAYEVEPETEIILAANDLEQSTGRAFKEIKKFIERSPILKSRVASMTAREIVLNDNTTIKAIPTDAAGEAGANQSLAGFDELWGYTSERSRRLWDELTPVPTRKNSIRFVATYAGYSGESELLEDLYKRGKEGKRLWTLLPVWENGPLFMYWDSKPRMPWQTKDYYAAQKAELRPVAYLRLHENQWVTSESGLFNMEKWDACINPEHSPPLPNKRINLSVGIDVSTKHDRSAVVSTYEENGKLKLGPKRFWQPSKESPMDFEETVEKFLLELKEDYSLNACRYDPYQFHRSAMTLRKKGLPMEEYPQSVPNLTAMGQNLFDLIEFKNLILYSCSDMRLEAERAIAKDSGRGLQIVKGKASHKIDQIICLAMASVDRGKLRVTPQVRFIDIQNEDSKIEDTRNEKGDLVRPKILPGQQLVEIDVNGIVIGYEVIGIPKNKRTWIPGISRKP